MSGILIIFGRGGVRRGILIIFGRGEYVEFTTGATRKFKVQTYLKPEVRNQSS
jgi:hypothetical protein